MKILIKSDIKRSNPKNRFGITLEEIASKLTQGSRGNAVEQVGAFYIRKYH